MNFDEELRKLGKAKALLAEEQNQLKYVEKINTFSFLLSLSSPID
jgi:hypothetical protein